MARGRMLNTTVAIDRRLNSLTLEAQLLYLMTVPHLDRDGLIIGDAPLLAAKAIPRRTELHPRVEELIQEWIAAGLAIAYEADDGRVLFFPSFRKNQNFQYAKEGASQFPPPPGYRRTKDGLEADPSAPTAPPTPELPKPTLETNRATLDLLKSDAGNGQDKGAVKLSEVKEEEKLTSVGASAGAVAPQENPLVVCLRYLDEPKANKNAALGRLYELRFGKVADVYPPNYGRLGTLAKKLSGEHKTLAQLIWNALVPEGDPHDYLHGLVEGTRAERKNGNGANRPRVDPAVAAARRKAADEFDNAASLARI